MSDSDEAVFADISVLIDFCRIYCEGARYADSVLNYIRESDTSLVVSEKSLDLLNEGVANRQRLLRKLKNKASEYYIDDSKSHTEFRADVLNYSFLDSNLPFSLNRTYLPEIESLRNRLNDMGLTEFRDELYDLNIQAKDQRFELENGLIDDVFDLGGRSTFELDLFIPDITGMPGQQKSLKDAAYWCGVGRSIILVSHNTDAYDNKNKYQKEVERVIGTTPDLKSPKEIFDNTKNITIDD